MRRATVLAIVIACVLTGVWCGDSEHHGERPQVSDSELVAFFVLRLPHGKEPPQVSRLYVRTGAAFGRKRIPGNSTGLSRHTPVELTAFIPPDTAILSVIPALVEFGFREELADLISPCITYVQTVSQIDRPRNADTTDVVRARDTVDIVYRPDTRFDLQASQTVVTADHVINLRFTPYYQTVREQWYIWVDTAAPAVGLPREESFGFVDLTDSFPPGMMQLPVRWYHTGGQLAAERGYLADSTGRLVKNGTFRRWRKDGLLVMETDYVDGKPHGRYRYWWENGQIKIESSFKYGMRNGRYRFWHYDGSPGGESWFNMGDGVMALHYPDDKPMLNHPYEDGRRCGVQREWYPNGHMAVEAEYVNCSESGSITRWYESGQPAEKRVKEGGSSVADTVWYRNGNIAQATSRADVNPAVYTNFYEDGSKRDETVRNRETATIVRMKWSGDGQLLELDSTDNSDGRNRVVREWDEEGNLVSVKRSLNETFEFHVREFYRDGSIRVEGYDVFQRKDSTWTYYDSLGRVERRELWRRGQLVDTLKAGSDSPQ